MSVLLSICSVALTVCASAYAAVLVRGENRRRMFAEAYGAVCDCAGRVGISAICTDADAGHIADLLRVEYERYEVIATLDSVRNPELLSELVERYCLVRVDYHPAGESAASEVRRLYRSRRRHFRRLVVADVVSVTPEADADAALYVAAYDYVMPVGRNTELRPEAVERMVAEMCSALQLPHEVYASSGAELSLFMRDDIVACGGFSSRARRFCRRRDRLRIAGVLATDKSADSGARICCRTAIVLFVAAAAVAFRTDIWPVVAVAASLSVTAAAVLCVMPLAAPHLRGADAFAYAMRDFAKNLGSYIRFSADRFQ